MLSLVEARAPRRARRHPRRPCVRRRSKPLAPERGAVKPGARDKTYPSDPVGFEPCCDAADVPPIAGSKHVEIRAGPAHWERLDYGHALNAGRLVNFGTAWRAGDEPREVTWQAMRDQRLPTTFGIPRSRRRSRCRLIGQRREVPTVRLEQRAACFRW